MKKIGFIGVGIMGKSMVRNLMKAGYEVATYTRTRSKAEDIIGGGAIWYDSAGECAKERQTVISITGYSKDVEDIYSGEGGIVANADPGTYLISMITAGPKLAVRIYEEAKKADLHALDAPVTGGDKGAKDGILTILASGDRENFDACLNILQTMGKDIDCEGKAGSEQHTKVCGQITVAGALAGACEVAVYARNVGLDVDAMLKSISAGVASSMQMNDVTSRALQGDYRPGFFTKHFIKDMNLADEEARAADTELKVLEDILSMYRELEQEGMGELGTQTLIKYYNW